MKYYCDFCLSIQESSTKCTKCGEIRFQPIIIEVQTQKINDEEFDL